MTLSLEQLSASVAGSTPALLQWVQTQLAAGHSPTTLIQTLIDAGWQPAVAQATLEAMTLQWAGQVSSQPPTSPARMPQPNLSGAHSIDVGDRKVQVLMSLQHPHVVLLDNLLSPQECEALIADARPAMERSKTVATQSSGGEEINPDRTSHGMFFQRGQTPVVQRLEARIAQLLQWPVDHGEGLQVLNYHPGAQYRPHHDYFNPQEPGSAALLRRGGQRLATMVIYLNEVPEGGCTYFPESRLRIHPRQGQAVFFGYPQPQAHTLTLHAGEPVLAGEKWIATKWLREHTFQ
ncbi:MAG: 2OG-Fe(II) oxygenase [Comamonas sp.]|nr:2OG-Fe(II) oxygenase [Candidatus Comamonas equi]